MPLVPSRSLLVLVATLFLAETSDLLLLAPKIRLLESNLCHRYYLSVDPSRIPSNGSAIDESLCKLTPIQAQLASVRGWQVFWDAIAGQ